MNNVTEQLEIADVEQASPVAVAPSPIVPSPELRVIAGYQLIEHIGEGGYGEVWRAEAPGGIQKAVKLVHGRVDERRAIEELKSLERIKIARHPFLLSLERIEVVDGQLIVVTELADESLKQRYEKCAAAGAAGIARDDLLRMLAEAADALDYMSKQHGLAHLDVKPENILLIGDHVKVADFGLVKQIHNATQSMVGGLTPLFAAPESFDGRPGDRSDQYSLAVVYQFALTGKLPFNGKTTAQLASQHITGRPDLSSLPAADRTIVERALAKDPFDRFETCRAFVDRLRAARGSIAVPRSDEATVDEAFHTEVLDGDAGDASIGRTTSTDDLPRLSSNITDLPALTIDEATTARPTLVIAIGGCGAKALRALSARVAARTEVPTVPSWFQTLLIDTDYDEFVSNFVDAESSVLDERDFVHLPLKPAQYYRQHSGELTRWLSRRWIYNIPRSMKTDGIRPLGRLAMVDHMRQLETKIDEVVAQLCGANGNEETCDVTNLPIDGTRPRVFLVGSISGGTGGAIYADVAQMIHRAFAKYEDIEPEIVCTLAHWTSASAEDAELSAVNACAALSELHHYKTDGCPGDATCHLPPLGRHHGLFKHVYYVDLGWHSQRAAFLSAADTLAAFLEENTLSTTSSFGAACRSETPETKSSGSTVRTFGMSTLDAQTLVETDTQAKRLAVEVMRRRWLTPHANDDLGADLAATAKQIVVEADISVESLTSQLTGFNRQRSDRFLAKAAATAPEELTSGMDAWRNAIDQHFPAKPTLRPATESNNDPMQIAIAKLLQQRGSLLQHSVAQRLTQSPTPVALATPLLQRVIGMVQAIKYQAVQQPRHDLLAGGDALTQITNYVEFAARRNTLGWLHQVAELFQASLQKSLTQVNRFVTGAEQMSQQLAGKNEDEAASTCDEELIDKVSAELEATIRQKFGNATKMLLQPEGDVKQMVTELLAIARRRILKQRLDVLLKATAPSALRRGGARRVLIAAPQALIDAGFVKAICEQLSATPTLLIHERPEILLWCEGEQVRLDEIVTSLVGHRPELRELSSQLRVRNDVAWASL